MRDQTGGTLSGQGREGEKWRRREVERKQKKMKKCFRADKNQQFVISIKESAKDPDGGGLMVEGMVEVCTEELSPLW